MKKFLLMLVSSLFVMAVELPQSIESAVSALNGDQVTVNTNVPQGMSGIVIHNYGNGISAITHTVISQGGNNAALGIYNAIEHENLPNIKSPTMNGDKVIFGNFYDNVLLLAPNEKSYSNLTSAIQKNWIHPDLYAMYLISEEETKITLENLKKFAKLNQVGLILIVAQNELRVLDPLSGVYLTKQPYSTSSADAMSPFYARFEQVSSGFFGTENKQNFAAYYKGVESIR